MSSPAVEHQDRLVDALHDIIEECSGPAFGEPEGITCMVTDLAERLLRMAGATRALLVQLELNGLQPLTRDWLSSQRSEEALVGHPEPWMGPVNTVRSMKGFGSTGPVAPWDPNARIKVSQEMGRPATVEIHQTFQTEDPDRIAQLFRKSLRGE